MIVEACSRISEFCDDHYKPALIINEKTVEEITNDFNNLLDD